MSPSAVQVSLLWNSTQLVHRAPNPPLTDPAHIEASTLHREHSIKRVPTVNADAPYRDPIVLRMSGPGYLLQSGDRTCCKSNMRFVGRIDWWIGCQRSASCIVQSGTTLAVTVEGLSSMHRQTFAFNKDYRQHGVKHFRET